MSKCAALIVLILTIPCHAQERFAAGELKGFSKSPTEHIIVRMHDPLTVSAVRGTLLFKDHNDPFKDATFEIRGPGTSERIRGAKSDSAGQFIIRHVPQGTCAFKATKDGFQSVVGTLIVSKREDRQKTIKIEMTVEV